jgi:hypothetical protein
MAQDTVTSTVELFTRDPDEAGSGVRETWEETGPRIGWRVAQVGLGVLLAGLVVAIVWLRLKARIG